MLDLTEAARDWSAVADAWAGRIDDADSPTAAATRAMIERAAVQPGHRVLELAAGPGGLGATWAKLVGPDGAVVLSDLAPGMVEVARRRTAALANTDVEVIDASAIGHPGASFDVVVSQMGLMFTPEPAVAFAEIHRVLAPGGRLSALTWAGPEHNPWLACVGMAAMVNGLVSGGPPVGPGGVFSLGDAGQLDALVEGAGFADVKVEEVAVCFRAGSISEHVTRVVAMAGPLAVALAAASPEQADAVRRTAAELATPYVTPTGVELPGRALLVSGRR